MRMDRALAGVASLMLVAGLVAACDEPEPTWAYRLSVLNEGDEERPDASVDREAAEAEFQRVLDCVLASYPDETEESVADSMYHGWGLSPKDVTLLEWGQALCPD